MISAEAPVLFAKVELLRPSTPLLPAPPTCVPYSCAPARPSHTSQAILCFMLSLVIPPPPPPPNPPTILQACDMFILELTLRSWIHSEENKRRTLQRNDIAAAITKTDIFDFLVGSGACLQ